MKPGPSPWVTISWLCLVGLLQTGNNPADTATLPE